MNLCLGIEFQDTCGYELFTLPVKIILYIFRYMNLKTFVLL